MEELDGIIEKEDYTQLSSLLNSELGDQTLNILFEKTRDGAINIKTDSGKGIWSTVIQNYNGDEKKIDSIYSKLAEYSRSKNRRRLDTVIWNILFAVFGGVCASFDSGYFSANKHYRRVINKRKKMIKKILEKND